MRQGETDGAAPGAARSAEAAIPTDAPPELTQVVAAWTSLPEHIKAAILALVNTAKEGSR